MKKYPKMKPSGVEWMGDVPEHWEMKKLKFLGKSIIGLTYNPEDISEKEGEGSLVLRASNIQNSSLSLENNVFVNSAVPEELKIQKGDILICARNGSRELVGKNICISDESLAGSTFGAFMTVFRTPYWRFISKIFASPIFKSQSGLYQTSTINQLTIGTLNNILVPFPFEENEQTAIAAYLDRKTAQIDQAIAEKEGLIELFREERQAIINHAVTKGIRAGVKMKASGVEWIGDVPEGWEVKKLKYLLKETDGAIRTGPFGSQLKSSELDDNGSYKVYNQRSVLDNDFESGSDFISNEKFEALKAFEIFPNDILITTRGTIGRCTIFPKNVQRGVLHPCLIRVQVDEEKVLKEWVVNYCNGTTYFLDNVLLVSNSTTIDVIYGYTLKEVFFPVPSLQEQSKILAYLNDKTAQIDTAISGIRQEIALLQEYRQALIFEAVTGKIDVRENA